MPMKRYSKARALLSDGLMSIQGHSLVGGLASQQGFSRCILQLESSRLADEKVRPPNECTEYKTKSSEGETSVLEL